MKLSDLESIVQALRAQSGVDANPNVRFYKPRTSNDPRPGPQEAEQFIEFEIPAYVLGECMDGASTYRVGASLNECTGKKGDYEIPLERVDFFVSQVSVFRA